ncbi:unnamed protein product [Spirodela intermedia]|uniref:Uncharacterized protein n=2 Tax=Spirodela intermedia TaxID=51605 RepID=A0ABN7E8S9_SPIIN|nr:unnamed protein product [Spirodela intermedia]CAA7392246.1 unnamed protein product [Spirodela intermedia]
MAAHHWEALTGACKAWTGSRSSARLQGLF